MNKVILDIAILRRNLGLSEFDIKYIILRCKTEPILFNVSRFIDD